MSQTVINNKDILQALLNLKAKQRVALIKSLDKNNICCLCECVYNVLKGKVHLMEKEKYKLKKHKTLLRKIIRKGEPYAKKKKLFSQKGGAILPLILAPLLSAILGCILK